MLGSVGGLVVVLKVAGTVTTVDGCDVVVVVTRVEGWVLHSVDSSVNNVVMSITSKKC